METRELIGKRRTGTVPKAPPRGRALLAVLLGGQAMATMDASIVNVAAPSIRTGLHASGGALQLIVTGYVLSFAVVLVIGARLGDRRGHARMFRLGLASFMAASLACGLAPSAAALTGLRVVQGAAAALLVPQVLSVIQLRFEGRALARAIGWYSMVLALGVAAGQLAGGLIVGADLLSAGWRPVFLVNVLVGAVLLAVCSRVLPMDRGTGAGRLDAPGSSLLAFAMVAVVLPAALGREHGWPPWTWCSFGAGCAAMAGFGWWETRLQRSGAEPLLDLTVLTRVGVRPGLAACCVVMGCYAAVFFTLTLHLQSGLGFTPLRAALTLLPYPAGFAAMGLTWTRMPVPVRSALPVAGPVAFAGAFLALAAPGYGRWPVVAAVPLLAVAGAGHAAGFSPLLSRITEAAGPGRASAVSALANTGSLLANVLGVAGLGGLYLSAAGPRATQSADALTRVAWSTALLLAFGAACAARAQRARHSPHPAVARHRDHVGCG
ncbi:MFS transporter [Actinocrinis puniceicyclus]|uniref:MFS transporter n=1 Tax=Actinocrinis puniceicyclus TaxID=977794 RepID=A0A8J7WMS0_9ACTN|nr:MFS transporter [Actinocrinis puniceicyclus]MBS2964188.1 MFS transporter [Actinocrinis puniceicyclus]